MENVLFHGIVRPSPSRSKSRYLSSKEKDLPTNKECKPKQPNYICMLKTIYTFTTSHESTFRDVTSSSKGDSSPHRKQEFDSKLLIGATYKLRISHINGSVVLSKNSIGGMTNTQARRAGDRHTISHPSLIFFETWGCPSSHQPTSEITIYPTMTA